MWDMTESATHVSCEEEGAMYFRKAVQTVLLSIIMILGLIAQAAAAPDPLDVWRQRNPLPRLGNHLYGIASNTRTCVVVGKDTNPLPNGGGRILTSTDGYNWVVRKSAMVDPVTGAPVIPYAVAWGNPDPVKYPKGVWIAVGNKGTIMKSLDDGITWKTTIQGYNDEDELRGIVFGKGKFVAVGKNGKVLTSREQMTPPVPIGNEWTKEVSPINSFLNGIAFDSVHGVFVAVGAPASPAMRTIITSTNGTDWGAVYPQAPSTTQKFTGITCGNGVFVAVGNYAGGGNALVSTDGAHWDPPRSTGETSTLNGIVYGKNRFVTVSSTSGAVLTSEDTNQWTKWASGIPGFPTAGSGSNILNGITFFKDIFIAIGSDSKLFTSVDGQSWTERASLASNFIYGVAYGNGIYAAVGWDGKVLTSTNKVVWVERKSGISGSLFGITFGQDKFVAVGSGGKIVTSENGTTWAVKATVTEALFGVAYGNNTFVAVGAKGKIMTSTDMGATWQSKNSGTTDYLYGVSYANGKFVAVGQNGRVLSSQTGSTWTDNTPGYTTDRPECLYGVTYGGSAYVVVGDNGRILTSPDFATWTKRSSGCTNGLRAVAFANNTLVVLGSGGKILTSSSPDGATWSAKTSGISYSLLGLVYGETDTLVVVGAYATILSSQYDTLTPWTIWTVRSTGTYKDLKAVAFGDHTFVAVGENGTVLTSKNGVTWDVKTVLPSVCCLDGVAYGNNRFVAVGNSNGNGRIYTSKDNGVTWTITHPLSYFTPSSLYGVTFGNGRFLAAGVDGIQLLSWNHPDYGAAGDWWYEEYLEGDYDIKAVTYADREYDNALPCLGHGIYIMVGAPNRTFLTSSTPEDWWMIRYAPFFPQDQKLGFTGIAYGAGVFSVVGPKVKIGKSADGGKTWKQVPLEDYTGTFDFTGITYGGNSTFTAVGTYGKILTSPNGKDWKFRRSGTTIDLYGMIYGASSSGNAYVGVGKDGLILQSGVIR